MGCCITSLPRPFLLLLVLIIASCGGQKLTRPGADFVEVRALAGQLGLTITRQTSNTCVMQTGEDRLLVIGPPRETLMINGEKIPAARVLSAGDSLWIARNLVDVIRVKLQKRGGEFAGRRVMIDPGHGGRDPGAPNAWGPSEKEVVLDISLRVRNLLTTQGVNVTMTRQDDTYPTLDERVAMANNIALELFVSIHADSAPAPDAHGFTVYVSRQASRASQLAARHMLDSLTLVGTRNRGMKQADFRVVAKTTCPAILIETGYLSCKEEAHRLGDASHRQRLAEAICQGILRHLAAVQG